MSSRPTSSKRGDRRHWEKIWRSCWIWATWTRTSTRTSCSSSKTTRICTNSSTLSSIDCVSPLPWNYKSHLKSNSSRKNSKTHKRRQLGQMTFAQATASSVKRSWDYSSNFGSGRTRRRRNMMKHCNNCSITPASTRNSRPNWRKFQTSPKNRRIESKSTNSK
jgi:hypothetical protein